jgi:hypothetical protein
LDSSQILPTIDYTLHCANHCLHISSTGSAFACSACNNIDIKVRKVEHFIKNKCFKAMKILRNSKTLICYVTVTLITQGQVGTTQTNRVLGCEEKVRREKKVREFEKRERDEK